MKILRMIANPGHIWMTRANEERSLQTEVSHLNVLVSAVLSVGHWYSSIYQIGLTDGTTIYLTEEVRREVINLGDEIGLFDIVQ